MAYIADSRFSELIQQLEAVHMCEIKKLLRENQKLRAKTPIDVENVDLQGLVVDIDNPGLENNDTFGVRLSGSSDETQYCRKPLVRLFENVEEKFDESREIVAVQHAESRGSFSSGGSMTSRPSLLRSISKRHGEHQRRMHWEKVPESAKAAWEREHGTTIESIEEETAHAMLALTRATNEALNSSVARKAPSLFASRVSDNKLSNSSLRMLSVGLDDRVGKIGLPMVDPGTIHRVAWDLLAALLIMYDLITIPLLVFDPGENLFTVLIGWTCLCFWSLDVLASCCTGIYLNGHLVMSRKIIVRHYLKTWFIVDCIAVVPDWVVKILDTATEVGRLGALVRLARGARVLRLLRLVKLKKLMNQFYDMIANEYMFIVVDLVKLLTMILVLNHIVACIWYAIGYWSLQSGRGTNWLEDVGRSPVYHGNIAWKYTTSLHWSITQFTAASLDIYATNTPERIFSVFIIFWGLLGLSSFVGSVTTTITALRNMSNDHRKQFWLLRKYLVQSRISQHLTVRILRYLEFKAAAKRNILPASKVLLLSQLSEQLCSELKKETNNLAVHPFFGVLGLQLTSFMERICNRALKDIEYAEHDVVFSAAQEAGGMFFVKAGSFRYSEDVELARDGFLSEAALWTMWWHRDSFVAVGDINEVITILHKPFGEIMCMHPQPWNFAQSYAEDFVKALNDQNPLSLSDISMNGFVKMLGGAQEIIWKNAQCNQSAVSDGRRNSFIWADQTHA